MFCLSVHQKPSFNSCVITLAIFLIDFIYLFIYLFIYWLRWVFRGCAWALSSCRGLLIAVASLVAEHRLQARRLQ